MITLEQLTEMLDMQEQLEIRIDGPDWRNKGHDYSLCIHMECAEIIDAVGWKHWKNIDQEPNWDAIAMELVDIWHFAMAYSLQTNQSNPQKLLDAIITAQSDSKSDIGIIENCLVLSISMYLHEVFQIGNFTSMMEHASMTWDDLYRLYIGKNILNWFRQDNGYKEGTYRKIWNGKEDNEHLYELTNQLGDNFSSVELIKSLTMRYALTVH